MANEMVSLQKKAASYASELESWLYKEISTPEKGLKIPEGYNYANEITSAMLYIANNVKDKDGRPAMQICTKDSIIMAVRDMAINGLSIIRNQVYPIVYGDKLALQTSYFGTMASLKNIFPNLDITANVLYEGDKFDYCYDERGQYYYIMNIRSSLENRDKPIIAAYGTIFDKTTGERIYGQVMTMKEIKMCWSHSKSKEQKVHSEFPQEMAQRTVINRLCKRFLKTATYREVSNAEQIAAFDRLSNAEYDFGDAIETTAEEAVDVDTRKAIHGKSQGVSGLSALLEKRQRQREPVGTGDATKEPHMDEPIEAEPMEKTPADEPIGEKQEIIPEEPENASEAQENALSEGFSEEQSYDYDELPF